MQDKVSSPPPAINLFKGPPPPTNFSENIVQYFNVTSEFEVLSDLVHYVQDVQSQQLATTRSTGVSVKEAFVPVPAKGSAKQIGNTVSFNATQTNAKTQIEFLGKLANLVKEQDPTMASEMNNILSQLQQMAPGFPKLTPEQLSSLNSMLSQLLSSSKQLPLSGQRAFWNTCANMLNHMMYNTQTNLSKAQNSLNDLQGKLASLKQTQNLLTGTLGILQAKPPTSEQFLGLAQNLQNLANQYATMSPLQQSSLTNFFQQLNLVKNGQGQSLFQTTADAVIQAKISEFVQNNPNATAGEITSYLKNFLNQSNLLSSPLPFMQSLGGSIGDVLSKQNYLVEGGFSDIPFASEREGGIAPNNGFFTALLSNYAVDSKSLKGVSTASEDLTNVLTDESKGHQEAIKGYQNAITTLNQQQSQLGEASASSILESLATGLPPSKKTKIQAGPASAAAAVGGTGGSVSAAAAGTGIPSLAGPPTNVPPPSGASGESLATQFRKAVLDHYMAEENEQLEMYAMSLFLSNMGAQAGNVLMNDTSDWGEASSNFSFSNWLHGTGGNYSGMSVAQAQAKLSQEKSQVTTDINEGNQALGDAQNQINAINKQLQNPDLTASQRATLTQMKSQLQGFIGNIQAALQQLAQLKTVLDGMVIVAPSGSGYSSSKYFGIDQVGTTTAWNNSAGLSTAENNVINGVPGATGVPSGGLVSISTNITSFQQQYSDQGETEQMGLQMSMTGFQQGLTSISSVMTLLNQIYMSFAQGISPT